MIGKLICFFSRKHKRGKRINDKTVKCPRCGSEWERIKGIAA